MPELSHIDPRTAALLVMDYHVDTLTKSGMIDRTRTALSANTFVAPEPGVMSFMMSKQGYLSDADGHWHPHLMFFVAHSDAAAWGANLRDSPINAAQSYPEPITTFFIPVTKWSDGTPDVMGK